MAAILDFQVANNFFLKYDPCRISMPNLVLVSSSERFFHLSAPLNGNMETFLLFHANTAYNNNNGLIIICPFRRPKTSTGTSLRPGQPLIHKIGSNPGRRDYIHLRLLNNHVVRPQHVTMLKLKLSPNTNFRYIHLLR